MPLNRVKNTRKRQRTGRKARDFNSKKRRRVSNSKRNGNRVGNKNKQKGGNPESVKNIMIQNLCRSTKRGESLKNKDSASYVHIQNLCSTADISSNNLNNFNSEFNNIEQSNSKSKSKSFLEGGFVGTMFKLATMPLTIASSGFKKVTGIDLENTVRDKVLNKVVGSESSNSEQEAVTVNTSGNNTVESKIQSNLEQKIGGGKRVSNSSK